MIWFAFSRSTCLEFSLFKEHPVLPLLVHPCRLIRPKESSLATARRCPPQSGEVLLHTLAWAIVYHAGFHQSKYRAIYPTRLRDYGCGLTGIYKQTGTVSRLVQKCGFTQIHGICLKGDNHDKTWMSATLYFDKPVSSRFIQSLTLEVQLSHTFTSGWFMLVLHCHWHSSFLLKDVHFMANLGRQAKIAGQHIWFIFFVVNNHTWSVSKIDKLASKSRTSER